MSKQEKSATCAGCGLPATHVLVMDGKGEVPVCEPCADGYGVPCPVGCGRCCEELWDRVTALKPKAWQKWRARRGATSRACPMQFRSVSFTYCNLPRWKRPKQCNRWLCPLALSVLEAKRNPGKVPCWLPGEAQVIVQAKAQWAPRRWKKLLEVKPC